MKMSDIIIPESFAQTHPRKEKIDACKEHWIKTGRQSKYIVIDKENRLTDGYVMYLVLMEHKEEYAEVKISHCRKKRCKRNNIKDYVVPRYRENSTTYIYGTHPNSKDERIYTWRVPESCTGWAYNIQIGDTVMCSTKFGYAPVVVNKIEILHKCPIDIPVKKVCSKEIRRNGIVVEL